MKIALFSDIHGNLEALNSILKALKNENIDKIICLGDVISIGPNSKECLDLIIKNDITLLLGNHELYYLYSPSIDPTIGNGEIAHQKYIKDSLNEEHYKFLKKCPINLQIKYKENNIFLSHFLIENINKTFPFYPLSILKEDYDDVIRKYNADYIFIGHKHEAFKKEVDGTLLIDIGSSGARKDNITSYYILDFKDYVDIQENKIQYDRELFVDTMNNVDYPDKDFIKKIFFGINRVEGK